MQEQMKREILDLLYKDELDINLILSKKTEYDKYCYEYDLDNYIEDFHNIMSKYFLIESTPINHEIDKDEIKASLDHFKDLKDGNIKGVTIKDVENILKALVNLIRNRLNQEEDILTYHFSGFCGKSRELAYFALEELGLNVTTNNAFNIPYSTCNHAFVTVEIPLEENGKVTNHTFLVDCTYRQFFTMDQNYFGRFFTGLKGFKNNTSPDPGYFIKNYEKDGVNIAEEICRNGFIELTNENARVYFGGFSASGITINASTSGKTEKITSINGEEYLDMLKSKKFYQDLDFDYEELYEKSDDLILSSPIPNITDKNIVPSI